MTARNVLILAGLGLILLAILGLLGTIGWLFTVLAYFSWTLADSARMAAVWGACAILCFWAVGCTLWAIGLAVRDVLAHPVVSR